MFARCVAGFLAASAAVAAIDTISVKGSKFFTSGGEQFFLKGDSLQRYGGLASCQLLTVDSQALRTSSYQMTHSSTRNSALATPTS